MVLAGTVRPLITQMYADIDELSRVISANQCFQWFEKSFSIVTERTL